MASLHAEFGKGLEQERMIVDAGLVFVTSSFAQHDSISCYTQGGKPLWELYFHPQIISWRVEGDFLFVYSKARQDSRIFLSCLNKNNGVVLWEK